MPARRELAKAAARQRGRAAAAESAWTRIVGDIFDPDAMTVVSVYIIAFLLMLDVMLSFPNLGETIARLADFQ